MEENREGRPQAVKRGRREGLLYRFHGSVGQAGIGEQADAHVADQKSLRSLVVGAGKGVHGLARTISTLQDSDECQTMERWLERVRRVVLGTTCQQPSPCIGV